MPYVITGLIILLGAWLFFWLIAIDGVSRNVKKFKKKRRELDNQVNKLLNKLRKTHRLFFFKQNTVTREIFDHIIDILQERVDVVETKDKLYDLLVYLQEQPFVYWWLVEKLNDIYATCEEAIDIMAKIRKYRKPLPKILKNIPDWNHQHYKSKGGLKNVVQQN